MKRFGAIMLVQFVVIFVGGFAGAWAFSHWRTPAAAAAGNEVSWFQAGLGLDAAQAARLEKLHQEFEAQQRELCAQHCDKRFKVAELLKTQSAMTPAIEALTRELADIEARSQRITIAHIFAVGRELNAAQREKFVAKVYERMCHSCPMDLHNRRPGDQASCDAPGCDCCVETDDQKPLPVAPLASASQVQPRLDLFAYKAFVDSSRPRFFSSSSFEDGPVADYGTPSLLLLYSVFRI